MTEGTRIARSGRKNRSEWPGGWAGPGRHDPHVADDEHGPKSRVDGLFGPRISGSSAHAYPDGRRSLLRLVEDALDLQGDRDLLADGDAAAGNRAVVADAPVRPVDLGGRREARPGAAVGVRAEAVDLKLQGDRAGGAADRELAVKQEVVAL